MVQAGRQRDSSERGAVTKGVTEKDNTKDCTSRGVKRLGDLLCSQVTLFAHAPKNLVLRPEGAIGISAARAFPGELSFYPTALQDVASLVMVNSLGCDTHSRAQRARERGKKAHHTLHPAVTFESHFILFLGVLALAVSFLLVLAPLVPVHSDLVTTSGPLPETIFPCFSFFHFSVIFFHFLHVLAFSFIVFPFFQFFFLPSRIASRFEH